MGVQGIGEELADPEGFKLARGKADRMDHHQLNVFGVGALVLVGAFNEGDADQAMALDLAPL